jgi:hypothetical protein
MGMTAAAIVFEAEIIIPKLTRDLEGMMHDGGWKVPPQGRLL